MTAQQLATPDELLVRQGFVDGTSPSYHITVGNVPGKLTSLAQAIKPKDSSGTYSAALLQLTETIGKVQRGETVERRQLPSDGFIDELMDVAFPFGQGASDFSMIVTRDYIKAACRIMYGTRREPVWIRL